MRKGGGHAKGASFEREICVHLSRFIDPKGKDTLFWRSAMSGGRATVQNRNGGKNRTQLGDITCIDPRGSWLVQNFILECKFYADLDLLSGFLKNKGRLAKFWRDLHKLAGKHEGLNPLLIARQNRTETLVLFDKRGREFFMAFKGKVPFLLESKPLNAWVCLFERVFPTE